MRVVVIVLIALAAAPAFAQPSLTPSTPAAADDTETSYRTYTIAADAASFGLILSGAASDHWSSTLVPVGLVGLMLATPVIHAARGHGQRAVLSFFMRPALAGIGAAGGILMSNCSSSSELFCGLGEAAIGSLVGFAAAAVLDAAFLTNEPREKKPPSWAPTVAPTHDGGMTFGVVGVL